MSDVPLGPGWWQASDERWYPPADEAPEPGWWLASDGHWYPPEQAPARREGRTVAKAPVRRRRRRPADGSRPASKAPTPVADGKTGDGPTGDGPTGHGPPGRRRGRSTIPAGEMIERRDAASRRDADVVAERRSAAAARVLAGFQAEVEAGEREARAADGRADPTTLPLLEVRPSALGADIEHIGTRLCVFTDRVELRDRLDRPREVVRGIDITDIVLHKRLGGTELTIECVDGPAIVTRGLRPDDAEAARTLIMKRTRRVGPVARSTDRGLVRSEAIVDTVNLTVPAEGWRPPVDEADLLRKLADLHRAGLLTDQEFEDKIELVAHLVRGDPVDDEPVATPAPATRL